MSATGESGDYAVILPEPFKRKAKKFFRKHPDLHERFEAVIATLTRDPFTPSLRMHALTGDLKGFWVVSLTYDYRIVLTIVVREREIELIAIGDHEDVY